MRHFNVLSLLVMVLFVGGLGSCSKDTDYIDNTKVGEQQVVELAKQWYTSSLTQQGSASGASKSGMFTPLWEDAEVLTGGGAGRLVSVPVTPQVKAAYGKAGFLRKLLVEVKGESASTGRIVELVGNAAFIKKNQTKILQGIGQQHIEGFDGSIILYDMNHNYLRGDVYMKGIKNRDTNAEILHKSSAVSLRVGSGKAVMNTGTNCTDWYIVTRWSDGSTTEEYLYTTCDNCETCIEAPGSGGGGAGDGEEEAPEFEVKVDKSITEHPKANCIFSKLETNSFFKEMVSSFENSSSRHVKFSLADDLKASGTTTWDYNTNTANVKIHQGTLEWQPAIWGATTFFHEALHAKLRQHAMATFGTIEISKWPKDINDMTLEELASHVDRTAAGTDSWQKATHDFMASNIEQMAYGLKFFVKNNYPATYTHVGSDLEPYKALSLMGLDKSTYWENEIAAKGKDAEFKAAWQEFVTHELHDCFQ